MLPEPDPVLNFYDPKPVPTPQSPPPPQIMIQFHPQQLLRNQNCLAWATPTLVTLQHKSQEVVELANQDKLLKCNALFTFIHLDVNCLSLPLFVLILY